MTIEGVIPSEIREEPDAIRRTLVNSRPAASRVARRLRQSRTRRIFLIGNGTSFHSCLAAAAVYRRGAGPADPLVVALTAGEFLNYPPQLDDSDALIGISASGEFRDVLAAIEHWRGRIPTIGVVHVPDSSLVRIADEIVVSDGGPSHVPVMTKTFGSTLVATQLILAELLGEDYAEAFISSSAAAADQMEIAIESAMTAVPPLVDRLASYEHVFVVGAGVAAVAAMEAALKLKEMALVHAEAAEVWEMASGAATMIGARAAVIAFAMEGPGHQAIVDVIRHAQNWGAYVIEVAGARSLDGSDLLPVPSSASEDHANLVAVPPMALLAYVLAGRRGATPDQPDWVKRYHSQGLHHILGG